MCLICQKARTMNLKKERDGGTIEKKKKRTEETGGAEQNFNESCGSWPSGPISHNM